MTTIHIDNDGPTLNRVIATGTTFADASPITRLAQEMVVLVSSSALVDPRPGVIMPAAALIGDYVEFHVDPASILAAGGQRPTYQVFNEVGDVIATGQDLAFRKVETTSDHLTWVFI
jgi:hypothetical protein